MASPAAGSARLASLVRNPKSRAAYRWVSVSRSFHCTQSRQDILQCNEDPSHIAPIVLSVAGPWEGTEWLLDGDGGCLRAGEEWKSVQGGVW